MKATMQSHDLISTVSKHGPDLDILCPRAEELPEFPMRWLPFC